MTLFHPSNPDTSDQARRTYALFELARTGVDFLAAMLFLIGSILFFWNAFETVAVWFFVVGSLCFALKPTLKLWRELRLVRDGKLAEIADASRPDP